MEMNGAFANAEDFTNSPVTLPLGDQLQTLSLPISKLSFNFYWLLR